LIRRLPPDELESPTETRTGMTPPLIVTGGGRGGCDDGGARPAEDALGKSGARAVVYCSFLPDVEVNRRFASMQLEDWRMRRAPRVGDRWIRRDDDDDGGGKRGDAVPGGMPLDGTDARTLTDLGKRLLGLAEWS
jgi:hypothetical protein